ncbi:MAG: FapA family protein [Treponema sp.]|jgi:uncharacterized protein (DUF342 family)|nr:FapA family protein [Treponema sp.]
MAAIIAKGNATIEVNPEETEAKLIFTPDPEGLGWDADAVIKLIGENRLSPPPSSKELEPFLQKAAKAKNTNPMETVIFEGTPPEQPAGETVNWETLPVPGDIEPLKDETLANAPPPQLFRIKTERIKHESIVKKPNPLPFLPPKEETVVTWEKKELREKAEVNPELLQLAFAERGKKLGTITLAKPGKPGKSVFNKPIPPEAAGDGTYLLGAGLHREKTDVKALYSGLLRIGENWADIVPLSKHIWSVDKGSDGVTLFFKFEPGDRRFPLPSGADIIAAAVEKGAAEENLIPENDIDDAIAESVKTGVAVLAFSLFEVQEAMARVDISPDKLEAVLNLRKGLAGALPLEMKAVSQALRDSKVQGIDMEKLKADIKTFMEGPETVLSDYPLAQGKAATRGKDREVQLTVTPFEEAEAKLILERIKTISPDKFSSDGAVVFPLPDITALALVEKGAVAARMVEPSAGEAGKDVFGNITPGLPGNDPDLKLFRGLAQHGADITASLGGLLLIHAAEKSFRGQVLDYRDAAVQVKISGDAMEAAVELTAEAGAGRPLTAETVIRALTEAGVVKGIDNSAAAAACAQAKSKGGSVVRALAFGELPQPRGAPRITWLLPELRSAALRPGTGARSVPVKAGQELAKIYPGPEEAVPGFDVKGTELPAENAVSLSVSHDDTVRETPRGDALILSAAFAGNLLYDGKDLKISNIQSVQGDVGKATGNISFSGELRISGKVESGYSVVGGGNVLIGGGAEQALVSAGGKVVITGGVKGAGKGVVRARGAIEAAFVDTATMLAVEDIKVKSGCVACNIKTNGKLIITGETGKLIGGVCRARHGVDAHDVGNEKGRVTEISFGQDYLIKDQIETAEGEIEKVHAALKQIEAKITGAVNNPAALNAARAEKVKLMKLLEQLKKKVFGLGGLNDKFEEHHESELRVRGTIYPGVVMESHGRYREIHQLHTAVIFYFDKETGQIKERSAAPEPLS